MIGDMRRRKFLASSAAAAAGMAPAAAPQDLPAPIRKLGPMAGGVTPISDEERRSRLDKARRLMATHRLDAILLEPGSSLYYYTGTRWGRSERLFALVLPARGEPAWVVPAFEERRARELIRFGADIRPWEEDESPYLRVAQVFSDRGLRAGRIGIEESVRFFIFDGLRKQAPAAQYASADPVTAGCRMIKSPAEIALMQRANDLTAAAMGATLQALGEGMTPQQLRANFAAACRAVGIEGGATAGFGQYSAFPHGSSSRQQLRQGEVVLIDAVCQLEGYHADITRTVVFGTPTARQRQVWDLERKAQDAALAAARPGATCESVDAAARKVITAAGFGPGYKVPGLPHRTGHGIGLEGHEWTYLVAGNKARLEAGMCFSDEPMIAIYGEFGVRLEDCFYMTEDGPRLFTPQSPSIEQPFA